MEYKGKNFNTVLEGNPTKFRHFKGNIYEIITIAKHTETEEDMVIYRAKETNKIWCRPASIFFSKVDKEKYPDVLAEYRFEIIK